MRKPRSCELVIYVLTVLLHRRLDYASVASASAFDSCSTPYDIDASSLRSMTSAFAFGCYRKRIRRADASCFASPTSNPIHDVVQQSRRSSKSMSTSREPTVLNSHDTQVAILLPEQSISIDGDDHGVNWHDESMHQLQNISEQYNLPIFAEQESIQQEEEHSHIVTAVPYPRTNTFALAIHHSSSPSSSSNRRNKPTKKKKPKKLKLDPLCIDLCPPSDTRLGYRLNKDTDSGGGEFLLKSLGLKKMLAEKNNNNKNDDPLVIYDLTAGLARDSLVILSSFLGSSVNSDQESLSMMPTIRLHMAERDPIVGTLVLDAMIRLNLLASSSSSSSDHQTSLVSLDERTMARQLTQCLTMERGDGVSVLNRLKMSNNDALLSSEVPSYPPDVIYLDPMFPPRKMKSSAVKKDMAMLHSLLGTAENAGDASPRTTLINNNALNEEINDEEEVDNAGEVTTRAKEEQTLLQAACNSAVRRVVVKRPVGAPPLGLSNEHDDDVANNHNRNDDADIIVGDTVDIVPKPSYEIRGSVNRFDVYMISS